MDFDSALIFVNNNSYSYILILMGMFFFGPVVIPAAAFAVITILSQSTSAALTKSWQFGTWQIPLTICYNIAFYLSKILWPINLSSHYPFPEPMSLSNNMVLAGLIGTIVLLIVLFVVWIGSMIWIIQTSTPSSI